MMDRTASNDLAKINTRLSVIELVTNSFIGVALGAALFASREWLPFVVIAVAYGAASILIGTLRSRERSAAHNSSGGAVNLFDGVRFVWRSSVLRTLAAVTGLVNFAMGAFFSVLVLYVRRFGGDPGYGFGISLAAVSIGSVLALAQGCRLRRLLGDCWGLRGSILVLTGSFGVIAAATQLPAALAGFVTLGFAVSLWGPIAVTFRQEVVPPSLLGRANAFYRLVSYGSAPLGAVFAGLVAEFGSVSNTGAICVLLTLLSWPLLALVSHRRMTEMRRLPRHPCEDAGCG